MEETLIRGDVVELQCILDFQKRGYYCSIPFSGSCRYDVVADVNGKLLRIQCKSSTYHEDTLHMSCCRQTTNTHSTTKYKYTSDEIDFFYTTWNGYGFLIPVQEVSTGKYLRLKEPLNGIQETMNIAADYLLDNVLDAIISHQPIKRYVENRFISIDKNGKEKEWKASELKSKYNDRQIRYIKEAIRENKMAYEMKWKFKEFPSL